jgi:hypothetical protein
MLSQFIWKNNINSVIILFYLIIKMKDIKVNLNQKLKWACGMDFLFKS